MQGLKYFLVVLCAVAGLSIGVRMVYSHKPDTAGQTPQATGPRAEAPRPAAPPAALVSAPAEKAPAHRKSTKPVQSPTIRRKAAPQNSIARHNVPNAPVVLDSAPGVVEPPKPATIVDTIKPAVEDPPWQATARQLVRDSAYVMASSGRLPAAIGVLDGWMRNHPTDAEIGLDLARLRARAGDWQGSIAQYTSLIEQNRSAPLLFERGQTYLWSGDEQRGEADLLASERMSPSVATERQLGDYYRWQGDFAKSSRWYKRAMRSAPADTGVRNSMRLLDRAIDARLLQPGELSGNDFGSGMQVISDNAGFDLYALRLSQAFGLGASAVMTVSGELRSTTQIASGLESQLDGYGFDVAMSSRIGSSKLTASVGMLDHGDDSPIVRGLVAADGFLGGARVRASVRRSPAYEVLWAPRMLSMAGSPATALQAQGSVSFDRESGGAYAMGELLSVSDDNTRTAFQLALRRRLAGSLSMVHTSSLMAYDQQTPLYYSPARYVSQALGLELARYREQGLSFALRATPGYAWIREPAGTADSTTLDLTAFQFSTGMDLGYRRGAWDLLLSTGLSSGREGGYRSQNAVLYLRRSW